MGPGNILIETNYFPSILYCTYFYTYEKVIVEAHENYQKHSFRNRCAIAQAQGVSFLTVPLNKGKNNRSPIKQTSISYLDNWPDLHLKSLRAAYGKSPFYYHYEEWVEQLIRPSYSSIFNLNFAILEALNELFQWPGKLYLSESYHSVVGDQTVDQRGKMAPKNFQNIALALPTYEQVFTDRLGHQSNLSILDLLFCRGPESVQILKANIAT